MSQLALYVDWRNSNPNYVPHIRLAAAQFCIDCDVIWQDSPKCPTCGSAHGVPLQKWLDRKESDAKTNE